MPRWVEILAFAEATGVQLVFGLAASYHRPTPTSGQNLTNVFAFLEYTRELNMPVAAFEHGNELSLVVNATALASDAVQIAQKIEELWPDQTIRPAFYAADTLTPAAGAWTKEYLATAGQYLQAYTYHQYVASALDGDVGSQILDPTKLQAGIEVFTSVEDVVDAALAPAGISIPIIGGEVGPCTGGGVSGITDRFHDFGWYINMLGGLAEVGAQSFYRSTLIGGDYELINRTSHLPNPDYWIARLWQQLTGDQAYHVNRTTLPSMLSVYALSGAVADTTVLVMANLSPNMTYSIPTLPGAKAWTGREVWKLRPTSYPDLSSQSSSLLNSQGQWNEVVMESDTQVPELQPIQEQASDPFVLGPYTYAFVRYAYTPTLL